MYAQDQPIRVTLPIRNLHHILPPLLHRYPQYVQTFLLEEQTAQVVITSRIALELITTLSNNSFSGYAILSNIPHGTSFREVHQALQAEHIDVVQVSSELEQGGYLVDLSDSAFRKINAVESFKLAHLSHRPLVAVSVDQIVEVRPPSPAPKKKTVSQQIGFRKSGGAVTRLSNGYTVSGFRSWRSNAKFPGISLPTERQ